MIDYSLLLVITELNQLINFHYLITSLISDLTSDTNMLFICS